MMKRVSLLLKSLLVIFIISVFITSVSATTITIIGGADGAEYSAYQLLYADDNGNGSYSYTVNEKYSAVILGATGKSNETDAIEHIAGLNASEIRAFADSVYRMIIDSLIDPDDHTANNRFENVEPGYYLIAETKTGGSSDIISLVMLDTAGKEDIEIQTKEDVPTVIQKVGETNDSINYNLLWQDAADHDIGDEIKFSVTSTFPANIKSYGSNYIYNFYVTLSDGLTLVYDENNVDDDGCSLDIVVLLDKSKIGTNNCTVTADADKKGFRVETSGLSAFSLTDANTLFTINYSAVLNDEAVTTNSGNYSCVYIEYSASPYSEGTAASVEDKVSVFTYRLNLESEDSKGVPLPGAGYTLYKYAYSTDNYNAVGEEQKSGTSFSFNGLDSGKYKLVQTTVPASYNRAADLVFVIDASYEAESDDPRLLSLVIRDEAGNLLNSFATSVENGTISAKMVSSKGLELPSTGGIGTTVFYVSGGALMVGAIVMLALKPNDESKKK